MCGFFPGTEEAVGAVLSVFAVALDAVEVIGVVDAVGAAADPEPVEWFAVGAGDAAAVSMPVTAAKPIAFAGVATISEAGMGVCDAIAVPPVPAWFSAIASVAFAAMPRATTDATVSTATAAVAGAGPVVSAKTEAKPIFPIFSALLTRTVLCSAVWRGFMWR